MASCSFWVHSTQITCEDFLLGSFIVPNQHLGTEICSHLLSLNCAAQCIPLLLFFSYTWKSSSAITSSLSSTMMIMASTFIPFAHKKISNPCCLFWVLPYDWRSDVLSWFKRYLPVGEPGSLSWIYASNFHMELPRAELPFPWTDLAHQR